MLAPVSGHKKSEFVKDAIEIDSRAFANPL
jgi:hypothetical protein